MRPEEVVGRTRALVISGALPVPGGSDRIIIRRPSANETAAVATGITFGVYINREFPLIGRCASVVRKSRRDPLLSV